MDHDDDERNILSDQGLPSTGKLAKYRLEPALLLIFFGYYLAMGIVPNQLLRQTCLIEGFNETICDHLGGNETEVEEKIQPKVAEILMAVTVINSVIPAITSLFLGPWTDKFGRKKIINSTCIGFSIAMATLLAISIYSSTCKIINPWLYVLPHLPIVLLGGWTSLLVAVLCYVTDLANEENRSSRLAVVEMIIFLGVFFATASCGVLLAKIGPTLVFLISTVSVSLATIFIIVFVDESVQNIESMSPLDQVKELFSIHPVHDLLKTCFKRRPFRERRILWCLIMILMITLFTLNGSSTVFYLFVREKFQWTLKQANRFDAISLIIAISGCVVGLTVLKKILHFSDMTLAVIAIISVIVDSVMKAFALDPNLMYVAAGISLFKILSSPMCRSVLSSIIPNNEIGKVYSVTSSFEAISGLIASPLYTYVYAKTLTWFSGAFFLITAASASISLILAVCVIQMKKTRELLMNPYSQINTS